MAADLRQTAEPPESLRWVIGSQHVEAWTNAAHWLHANSHIDDGFVRQRVTGDPCVDCWRAAVFAAKGVVLAGYQRPGCPDPIECDHEAAAGQAEAEAAQLRAELDRTAAELAEARAQLAGVWPCTCSHLPGAHKYDSVIGRNFCIHCKPDTDLHDYTAAPTTT